MIPDRDGLHPALLAPEASEALAFIRRFADDHARDTEGWQVILHALHWHGLYNMEDACYASITSTLPSVVRSVARAVRAGEIPRLADI